MGEIAFPRGAQATVGKPFEIVATVETSRPESCYSARWSVAAPDGTEHDVFGGYRQVGCSKEPGKATVRAVFWNPQPGPSSRKPWPMLAGHYRVRVEISQYKNGLEEIRRGETGAGLGPAIVGSAEFVALDPLHPRHRPQPRTTCCEP